MFDRNIGEGGRGRKADPTFTRDVERWLLSIAERDRVYAVSYRQAIDSSKSPEIARAVAREAFLRSFETSPEVMLVVNLEPKAFDG